MLLPWGCLAAEEVGCQCQPPIFGLVEWPPSCFVFFCCSLPACALPSPLSTLDGSLQTAATRYPKMLLLDFSRLSSLVSTHRTCASSRRGWHSVFPWQMTPAMLHRRAVLSSWTASREGSWETSPPKFSQGATRRKEIPKRAGLQQGVINIFQINEAFFSSSSEMERCGGRECRCTWSCCTWVSSWPPVHLQ